MNEQRNNGKSMAMMVSAMLIFGTIGIFRRFLPLSSGFLAFARGAIGGLFLLVYIQIQGLRKKNKELAARNAATLDRAAGNEATDETASNDTANEAADEPADKTALPLGLENLLAVMPSAAKTAWLAVAGAAIGVNWILLFEAYNYTTVPTATLCYYMQPTIVLLLSPLIFRERLTARKAICAAVAIVGMVLVSGILDGGAGAATNAADNTRGILYGLGAAVFYSIVVIMNKKIGSVDAYYKTVIQLFSAALVMIPYLLVTRDFGRGPIQASTVVLLLVVGLVHTGFAYVLYFGSMDGLRAQTIALFSYIDPVAALLLAAVVLHEALSVAGIIGAVMILGAAVVSELELPGKAAE
ncbi:MAG: EamA family transporter [Mogibacterium sp.]|nr:EamA family transporter [Mogibacterium sp.]